MLEPKWLLTAPSLESPCSLGANCQTASWENSNMLDLATDLRLPYTDLDLKMGTTVGLVWFVFKQNQQIRF